MTSNSFEYLESCIKARQWEKVVAQRGIKMHIIPHLPLAKFQKPAGTITTWLIRLKYINI